MEAKQKMNLLAKYAQDNIGMNSRDSGSKNSNTLH